MDNLINRVIPVAIEDEVKESYLNYAMSVIVSRALPDVRDGLKPVHRRILFAMNEMGLHHDRSYVKAGRIVGDVLGKYHPHGDQSIYDALVRLAQDFSLRYPVIRGQGNFGSLDGDPPAAMRYTEAKLESISEFILNDIKKETVDFVPNYDDSLEEPAVLPGALPFLLVNGGSGIAVGMATNMPPHNLREVCEAIIAFIDNPEISISELMKFIKGPDFPTGASIFGTRGIGIAYKTGKGRIVVRGKVTLEQSKSGKDIIIVNEIPYMVNKANLVVRIADLVKEKVIEGIGDLRDESGRAEPVRIVIELKKGASPKVVLNQLFTHTPLQSSFNVNNLALVDGKPRQLNLKELIEYYVMHRQEVVTRRTRYDLKKAEERAHILEGLKIAIENIDEVVAIIKQSANVDDARQKLINRFGLTEIQAQAILDMRLQRLTSLETKKIIDELTELYKMIAYYKELLADEKKILAVIKDEVKILNEKFGDDRKTEIIKEELEEFDIEDLIVKEDMVILISHNGLIKRMPVSAYKRQGRGGRGSSSITMREDDFIEHLFIASTHDYILFITNEGKAYWLKVYEIPEGSRVSRGQSIKMLFSLSPDEEVATILSLKGFSDETNVVIATSKGIVKKVKTIEFENAKTRGIIAIKLDASDKVVSAILTSGNNEVMLVTREGNALRFHEEAIRSMGRATRGITGIKLSNKDELSGLIRVTEQEEMLIVTENGYGKRIDYINFSPHGRATRGQVCYKTHEKTGQIVGLISVKEEDDLVCITSQGNIIKLRINAIPVQGKMASGVHIVNIEKPDMVVGIAKAVEEEGDDAVELE